MFYTGKVQAKDLFNEIVGKITAVQPGESKPWWNKESSLEADGVFTSTGTTGTNRIVAILRPGVTGHYITTGFARDYTAGAINTTGAFDVPDVSNLEYFSAVQPQTALVTYNINVTKDRIIINIQGDKLIAQWSNSVAFIGMPTRYDLSDKYCVLRVQSTHAPVATRGRLIQDSLNQTLQDYIWYYTASPGNPSWGNNHFLEPLHFGKTGEGLRGELDGIYGIHSDGVVNGEVINSNGVDYLIIKRSASGANGFPRETLALKMS